jgi:hypothetical protein
LSPSDLDAFMDASAQVLDLPLDPAWRPGVRANLEVSLKLAQFVAAFELPDEAEPSPVFEA